LHRAFWKQFSVFNSVDRPPSLQGAQHTQDGCCVTETHNKVFVVLTYTICAA